MNFSRVVKRILIFLKIKIFSLGFNNSLDSRNQLAICLLKNTLKHSSVAIFSSHFNTLSMVADFLLNKYIIYIFVNIRSKSIFLELFS